MTISGLLRGRKARNVIPHDNFQVEGPGWVTDTRRPASPHLEDGGGGSGRKHGRVLRQRHGGS